MLFFPFLRLAGDSPLPLDVGISFGGIQHSSVSDSSAASCNFGIPAKEDEHTSFYSAILFPAHILLSIEYIHILEYSSYTIMCIR